MPKQRPPMGGRRTGRSRNGGGQHAHNAGHVHEVFDTVTQEGGTPMHTHQIHQGDGSYGADRTGYPFSGGSGQGDWTASSNWSTSRAGDHRHPRPITAGGGRQTRSGTYSEGWGGGNTTRGARKRSHKRRRKHCRKVQGLGTVCPGDPTY